MGFLPRRRLPSLSQYEQVDHIHLLTNGNVLIATGSAASWLLVPDDTGSYQNGSFHRLGDMPSSHRFNGVSMDNLGRIHIHGGEYGSAVFNGAASVFDPATGQWAFQSSSLESGRNHVAAVAVSDDGRHFGSYTVLAADGTYPPTTSPAGDYQWASECGIFLMPDGRFLSFNGYPGSADAKMVVIHPGYDSAFVAAGSASGSAGITEIALGNQAAWDARWGSRSWRTTKRSWTSDGLSVNYEIGPAGWMPKIGKAVLIGGTGSIFTYDPSTGTLARPAELPMEPQATAGVTKSRIIGKLPSYLSGLTAQGLYGFAAGMTLPVDASGQLSGVADFVALLVDPANAYPNEFYIRVGGNTQWARLRYTAMSYDSTAQRFDFTLTSYIDGAQTVATSLNAEVCFGRPSYEPRDSPGAFLPNGDFIFVAGIEKDPNSGFNSYSTILKWDGSSSVADIVATQQVYGVEYAMQMIPLPNGQILIHCGSNADDIQTGPMIQIYDPTTSELTPFSGSRPVVTSFPSTIRGGTKVTLAGQQLNGLHEGGFYGDDGSSRTNFPLVRLTNNSTGKVHYCRTTNFSYRGIQPGRASTCDVIIPNVLPAGTYTMEAVASGTPSTGQTVTVVAAASQAESIFINPFRT